MFKERVTCETNPAFGDGFAIEGRIPKMIYPTSRGYGLGPFCKEYGGTREIIGTEDPNIIILQTDHVPLFPLERRYLAGGGFRDLVWADKESRGEALHRHLVLFSSFDRDTLYGLRHELRHVSDEETIEIFKKMPVCIISPGEGIFFQAAERTLASLKYGEGMNYEDSNLDVSEAFIDNKTARFTPDQLRMVHTLTKNVDMVIETSIGTGIMNGKAGCTFASEDFDEADALVKGLISSGNLTDDNLRKIVHPFFVFE